MTPPFANPFALQAQLIRFAGEAMTANLRLVQAISRQAMALPGLQMQCFGLVITAGPRPAAPADVPSSAKANRPATRRRTGDIVDVDLEPVVEPAASPALAAEPAGIAPRGGEATRATTRATTPTAPAASSRRTRTAARTTAPADASPGTRRPRAPSKPPAMPGKGSTKDR